MELSSWILGRQASRCENIILLSKSFNIYKYSNWHNIISMFFKINNNDNNNNRLVMQVKICLDLYFQAWLAILLSAQMGSENQPLLLLLMVCVDMMNLNLLFVVKLLIGNSLRKFGVMLSR
jgi:hypothetical protein